MHASRAYLAVESGREVAGVCIQAEPPFRDWEGGDVCRSKRDMPTFGVWGIWGCVQIHVGTTCDTKPAFMDVECWRAACCASASATMSIWAMSSGTPSSGSLVRGFLLRHREGQREGKRDIVICGYRWVYVGAGG